MRNEYVKNGHLSRIQKWKTNSMTQLSWEKKQIIKNTEIINDESVMEERIPTRLICLILGTEFSCVVISIFFIGILK